MRRKGESLKESCRKKLMDEVITRGDQSFGTSHISRARVVCITIHPSTMCNDFEMVEALQM